jgi:arylsulfatase A-like enzyme
MKMSRSFRPAWSAAVLGLAALLAASCAGERRPRNVLLLTLDTLRADHVGAYPGAKAATPVLDGLAKRGTLFENAWSLIPMTLPSHASIFYSQYPHDIKNYNNGQVIQAKRTRPSLANAFRKEGFATAAFVSLGVLGPSFNLTEGFEDYRAAFPGGRWYLHAEEVNRDVIPWLEQHRDERFFLWVHYSDPHDPYATPDAPDDLKLAFNGRALGSYNLSKYITYDVELDLRPGTNEIVFETLNPYVANPTQFMARLDLLTITAADGGELFWEHAHKWYVRPDDNVHFLMNGAVLSVKTPTARKAVMTFRGKPLLPLEAVRALYRGEVEYMDGQIGELERALKRLGLADDTAVVAVSDHGEGLGEYASDFGDPHVGHIHYLQKIYMHVPLILSVPGRPGGVRRAEPVTLLDVAPTISRFMGLRPFASFAGRDLFELAPGTEVPVFMETFRPEAFKNRFALLRGPWHMILSPEDGHHDLYDLAADPQARVNQWEVPDPPVDRVKDIERDLNDFARTVLKGKVEIAIDSKTEEMLRSLGYIKK